MSEIGYELLSKEERSYTSADAPINNKTRKHKCCRRIVDRFSLPDPVDTVGRRKEKLEKISLIITIVWFIIASGFVIAVVFTYPVPVATERTITTMSTFQMCFLTKSFGTILGGSFGFNDTRIWCLQ